MYYLARKLRNEQKKEASGEYERLQSQSSNGGKALEPLMEGEHSEGSEDVFLEDVESGVAHV